MFVQIPLTDKTVHRRTENISLVGIVHSWEPQKIQQEVTENKSTVHKRS